MNPVQLLLISTGLTIVTAVIGFFIRHWIGTKETDIRELRKSVDDHIKESAHVCEANREKIWEAVNKQDSEQDNVNKQLSKLDHIDKQISDVSPKALEIEFRNMQKRLNVLDGGEQYESGRIKKLEESVEKVSKAMNIEAEVSQLKKEVGDLKKDVKELTESIHRIELNLSEKYVTKDTYEAGQWMISDKLDRMLRIISSKFKTGAQTQLNMAVISEDD